MSQIGWWIGWLAVTITYNRWVWPIHWEPQSFSPWIFAFDALKWGLVCYWLRTFTKRKSLYASKRYVWGNVIRGHELEAIQAKVAQLLEMEGDANCAKCGGKGQVPAPEPGGEGEPWPLVTCKPCRGTGFAKGVVAPPFQVPYRGRNAVFLGFDVINMGPFYLEGEARFCTTNVFSIQGGGKTKRVGYHILNQTFADPNASMVYFSLKMPDAQAVAALARTAGWHVVFVKGLTLLEVFSSWHEFEDGLRKGLFAAGYKTRESFWLDRTLQLLQEAYQDHLRDHATARLGPLLEQVEAKLRAESEAGIKNNADRTAFSDVWSYLKEFNDATSSVRWVYDASPEDLVPGDRVGVWRRGRWPDWEPLAGAKVIYIVPPIEKSKAGIVAATALKYSCFLWFEKNKDRFFNENPEQRHAIVFYQDEGDQFILTAENPTDLSDNYANTKWRETGVSSFVFTQSMEELAKAVTKERLDAYLQSVQNVLTLKLPDDGLRRFIDRLPKYELKRRVRSVNRSSQAYDDEAGKIAGNLRVQVSESLQIQEGPWITAEIYQQLPRGCAIFQQAGAVPRVLWMPYWRHVRFG